MPERGDDNILKNSQKKHPVGNYMNVYFYPLTKLFVSTGCSEILPEEKVELRYSIKARQRKG